MATANLRQTLASLLKEIEETTTPDIVRRLIDPNAGVALYLAAQAPGGHPGLLLRVPKTAVPSAKILPEGTGFVLRSVVIPEGQGESANLALFCTDRSYDDVFMVFAADVVERVLDTKTPAAALEAFLGRIALWERFFRAGMDAGLSMDAQAGLFAELLVLRDLVIPSVGATMGIEGWRGPSRAPQDFVIQDVAIEVKSSRAKSAEKMTIASELQLDDRPFRKLGLAWVLLSEGGTGCQGLNELISEIEQQVKGNGLALGYFKDRLLRAGWLSAQADRYSETRFFVRAVAYYQVVQGFPRIIQGDFPAGVGGIGYTVDASSAERFKVDEQAVRAWLS